MPLNEKLLRDFNFLFNSFDRSFVDFFIWYYIFDKKTVNKRKNIYIFGTIYNSILENTLLNLTKILIHHPKSISINSLTKYKNAKVNSLVREFRSKHEESIANLDEWRNNYLAHFDNDLVGDMINLSKNYPLKISKIKSMIFHFSNILEKISNEIDGGFPYYKYFSGQKNYTIEQVDLFFKKIKY